MTKPNIIIIYTDQQRYDTLGSSGNALIQTPNLDRLAAEGTCFSNAFVTCPICVPSRVSLWTGRYNHTNLSYNNHRLMSERETDFVSVFREHGYTTALIGKDHCFPGPREEEIFDHRITGGHAGFNPSVNDAGQRNLDVRQGKMQVPMAADPVDAEENPTAQICREGCRYVENAADDIPFLLWLSIPDPHPPYMVAEPWASMYGDVGIPRPVWCEGETGNKPYRQQLITQWNRYDKEYPGDDIMRLRQIYWGMVSCIDEHVGRLIALLKDKSFDDNTIVVYTSDHGDYMGDHKMIRKGVNVYDVLVHVPLIVWGKEVLAHNTEAMVENIDILPTLAQLADIPIPDGVQGRSFAKVLLGETDAHRDCVHLEHGDPGRPLRPGDLSAAEHEELAADTGHHLCRIISRGRVKGIRTRRWKYCVTPGDVDELYDLENDPGELDNLAAAPQHADVVHDLRARLLQWEVETEETRFWQ